MTTPSWAETRSPHQQKKLGQWPTPEWVIEGVLDRIEGTPESVLDPACGDGRWLAAAARRWPGARLMGWDVDPAAIAAARERAPGADLQVRDALEGSEQRVAQWVVGNPPYIRPQHLPAAQRARVWKRYSTATDKVDLSAPFVERMLELGSRVALVLPDAWLSLTSYRALRALVRRRGVGWLARLPGDTFAATVGCVVLMDGPEDRWASLDREGWVERGPVHWTAEGLPLEGAPLVLEGEGTLRDHCRLRMGVVCGSYGEWVHRGPPQAADRATCRGRDVRRWQIGGGQEWLRYEPREMLRRRPYVAPKSAALFDVAEKVVLAGASGRQLRAAVDTARRFPLDSCYVSEASSDPWGLAGLLNSAPVNAWYGARYPLARVKAVELHTLPWPRGGLGELAEASRASDQAGVDAAAARAYGLP